MEIKYLQSMLKRNAAEITRLEECVVVCKVTFSWSRDEEYLKAARLARKKAVKLGKIQKALKGEIRWMVREDREFNAVMRPVLRSFAGDFEVGGVLLK